MFYEKDFNLEIDIRERRVHCSRWNMIIIMEMTCWCIDFNDFLSFTLNIINYYLPFAMWIELNTKLEK